jgi:hypothetical protein
VIPTPFVYNNLVILKLEGDPVKKTLGMTVVAAVLAIASSAQAAIVTVQDNIAESYFDIFYTVSENGEFTNWDLKVTPGIGGLLDPNTNNRSDNTSDGAAMDTFVNTVFSSVGAGPASYVFTEYNPGSAFPPVPAQPRPQKGAVFPAPDELNWSVFDTATGDANIPGVFPYHMARVMYTPGGGGTGVAQFFDTTNAGIGETFEFAYGIPEPGSLALAGVAAIGALVVRRRK